MNADEIVKALREMALYVRKNYQKDTSNDKFVELTLEIDDYNYNGNIFTDAANLIEQLSKK